MQNFIMEIIRKVNIIPLQGIRRHQAHAKTGAGTTILIPSASAIPHATATATAAPTGNMPADN